MRVLPPSLAAAFSRDSLSLAMLYTLTRSDGIVVRVAGHDRDIRIDDLCWTAGASAEAGSTEQETGLAASSSSLAGALNAAAISDDDLAAGRWVGASVEVAIADWQEPLVAFSIWSGRIASTTRRDSAFEIEFEGLEAGLSATIGRNFQRQCDARLGDIRCGVNLSAPGLSATTSLIAMTGDRVLDVERPAGLLEQRLAGGSVRFGSGPMAGLSFQIEAASGHSTDLSVRLAAPLPLTPAPGDSLTLTIACDGALSTCRDVFANAINFRGCPHMPGDGASFAGPDTDLSGDAD